MVMVPWYAEICELNKTSFVIVFDSNLIEAVLIRAAGNVRG